MNVKKLSIYIILSLLLMFSVFANSNYMGVGNSKYIAGNCRNWLFSSCNPSVDDFSSLNTLTQTNSFNPIVYGNLNLNKYEVTQNYIYTFNANNINIYDSSDLNIFSANSIQETIMTQPKLLSVNAFNQTSYYLVFIGKISNDYKLVAYGMDLNDNLIRAISFNVSNKSVDMDISRFGSYIPIMLNNGTIQVYNILGSKIKDYNTGVSSGIFLSVNQPPLTNNYLTVQDIDNDGVNEVAYSITYQNTPQTVDNLIGIFKLNDDLDVVLNPTNILLATTFSTNPPTITEHNIEFVTHGSSLSLPKIYLHSRFSKFSSTTTYYFTTGVIVGQSGTILYSSPQTTNSQKTQYESNMIFTDYNLDGIVEMCINQNEYFVGENKFKCYDATYKLIENISTTFTSSKYISLGKINDNYNTTKMSILTSEGIYNFYNNTHVIKIMNFSLNSDAYPIFINLVNKINYTNDLMFINQNYIYTSISAGVEATCGDLVCSTLENNLNCPVDCNVENENINQTVLLNPYALCTLNSQCKSGRCSNNKCSLYDFNHICTLNAQCISNSCEGGKCSKESLEQSLTNNKNELVGNDDKSSSLFSILVIAIISLVLGIVVYSFTSNGVAFMGSALLGLIVGLIVLTFIGWLNPFILLGLFILIIGLGMLYFFSRSSI